MYKEKIVLVNKLGLMKMFSGRVGFLANGSEASYWFWQDTSEKLLTWFMTNIKGMHQNWINSVMTQPKKEIGGN